MSRKRNISTLPRMSKNQRILWNDLYLYGQQELMSQRQRRTAFTLQQKIGRGNIEIFTPECNESLEFIRFKKEFATKIGGLIEAGLAIDKTKI